MPKQELDGVELFNLSLSIVGTVLRDGDQRVSDLAELFEVSEAAIEKAVMAVANSEDVKNCETHFYVDVDELAEGYVSLSQGMSSLSEPPSLSRRQLSSIAIGLDYLAAIPQFKADADLQALRALISESSPASATSHIPSRLTEQIETLQEAMSKELAIECEYINQTGAKSSRTIDEVTASAEAAEIFWNFPVAGNTKRTGDQLHGSIRVGNLAALGRHVAKYGGMVKVIAPESARSAVRDFAQRALAGASAPGDED